MSVTFLRKLVNSGVDKTQDRLKQQRAILTNSLTISTIVFILVLITMVIFFGLFNQLWVGIALMLALSSVFVMNRAGHFTLASILLVNLTSGSILIASYIAYAEGIYADTENWLIGFIAVSVFLFDRRLLAYQFSIIFLEIIAAKYLKFYLLDLPIDRDFAILFTNTVVMCAGMYLSLVIVKRALTRSLENLRKSNETKKKLLSIIAHDIKSPLTTFEALLSVGKIGLINQQDFIKHQEELRAKFEPLNDTINSVLGWSAVQTDDIRPSLSKFDLLDCVRKIVMAYQGFADGKNIKINVVGEAEMVLMDEDHFKLIVRNILHNALKFTPHEGVVNLTIQKGARGVELVIDDTGVGMSAEMVENILKKRVVLSTVGTRGEKGTGLGLNVCMELLKANKCEVEITSQVDKGSTFRLIIPS